ncbi:MAG: Nanos 1 [Paramarteilia canceri]
MNNSCFLTNSPESQFGPIGPIRHEVQKSETSDFNSILGSPADCRMSLLEVDYFGLSERLGDIFNSGKELDQISKLNRRLVNPEVLSDLSELKKPTNGLYFNNSDLFNDKPNTEKFPSLSEAVNNLANQKPLEISQPSDNFRLQKPVFQTETDPFLSWLSIEGELFDELDISEEATNTSNQSNLKSDKAFSNPAFSNSQTVSKFGVNFFKEPEKDHLDNSDRISSRSVSPMSALNDPLNPSCTTGSSKVYSSNTSPKSPKIEYNSVWSSFIRLMSDANSKTRTNNSNVAQPANNSNSNRSIGSVSPQFPVQNSINQTQLNSLNSVISPSSFCGFCRNNGECEKIYKGHRLKDNTGRVICPVLRSYTCPICQSNGDNAHTLKYCPMNTKQDDLQRFRVHETPRTSAGFRRHPHRSTQAVSSSTSCTGNSSYINTPSIQQNRSVVMVQKQRH